MGSLTTNGKGKWRYQDASFKSAITRRFTNEKLATDYARTADFQIGTIKSIFKSGELSTTRAKNVPLNLEDSKIMVAQLKKAGIESVTPDIAERIYGYLFSGGTEFTLRTLYPVFREWREGEPKNKVDWSNYSYWGERSTIADIPLTDITPLVLSQDRQIENKKGLGKEGLNAKRISLHKMWEYAINILSVGLERGMIKNTLSVGKKKKSKPDSYTDAEMKKILQGCRDWDCGTEYYGKAWTFRRLAPLVELAYLTALRRYDIERIEWSMIKHREEIPYLKAFVKNKRDEGMTIFLQPRAVELLIELEDYSGDQKYVFPSFSVRRPGKPMSRGWDRQFIKIVDDVCPRKANPFHSLRHTRATKIIKETNDLRLAQFKLGHASIETTRRYDDAHDETLLKLREAEAQMSDSKAKGKRVSGKVVPFKR